MTSKRNKGRKVFAAMSGGVDSSVAALLLKERGYDVTGVFMRCYSAGGGSPPEADGPRAHAFGRNADSCTWERDAEDARRVAGHLGIPFYVWDFEDEYKKRVVEYMVDGYRKGITPNPDVMCNKEIKFGLFLERALELGADYIATGHYVRTRDAKGSRMHANDANVSSRHSHGFALSSRRLFQAIDLNKDQSYFLWTLNQDQLRHCLFPIGEYLKSEVRDIARKAGLLTAEKKDSQGICFLGKITLADFLKEYIPEKRGLVLTAAGKKIGEHIGAHFYTIGQRHGLNLSEKRKGKREKHDTKPHYVAEKDVLANTIVVAEGSTNPALYRNEVNLQDLNFIKSPHSPIRANWRMRVLARVRYRQPLAKAMLTFADLTQTGAERSPRKSAYSPRRSVLLVFEQRQKFVAPGQSAVFYTESPSASSGLEMLGGGVIEK